MRIVQRVALLFFILGFFSQYAASEVLKKKILLMPFKDKTDFRGAWNIEREVPAYLGKMLAENPFYQVLPMDSLYKAFEGQKVPKDPLALGKMGETLGADIVLTGEIEEFNVSRFGMGMPMLGGYRSYSAEVEFKVKLIRVIDGKELGVISGEGDVKDRTASLNLLGKPSKRDSQFYGLDSIPFGSEQFKQTIIGEVCLQAFEELKAKIEEIVVRPRQVVGQILMVENNKKVYLNIGIEDGLELGDKLGVYEEGQELTDPETGQVVGRADDRKVGSIQIIALKAAHFSKAEILEGHAVVSAEHLVKTEYIDAQE